MNILVIKIGALGDVARSSFIAQALKDKYRLEKPLFQPETARQCAVKIPIRRNRAGV